MNSMIQKIFQGRVITGDMKKCHLQEQKDRERELAEKEIQQDKAWEKIDCRFPNRNRDEPPPFKATMDDHKQVFVTLTRNKNAVPYLLIDSFGNINENVVNKIRGEGDKNCQRFSWKTS